MTKQFVKNLINALPEEILIVGDYQNKEMCIDFDGEKQSIDLTDSIKIKYYTKNINWGEDSFVGSTQISLAILMEFFPVWMALQLHEKVSVLIQELPSSKFTYRWKIKEKLLIISKEIGLI